MIRMTDETYSVGTLEAQISDLQSEASRLLRNLEIQKDQYESERGETKRRDTDRDVRLSKVTSENESLRSRVKQYADYDEIKRELDIMKFVEFSGMNLDEDADNEFEDSASVSDIVRMPDPNADKANRSRGKPLENLLMGKNRKLQEDLTSLRVRYHRL